MNTIFKYSMMFAAALTFAMGATSCSDDNNGGNNDDPIIYKKSLFCLPIQPLLEGKRGFFVS